jgi:hypothetical protein
MRVSVWWIFSLLCAIAQAPGSATVEIAAAPDVGAVPPAAVDRFERGTRFTSLGGGVSLGTRDYGGTVAHDLAVLHLQYGTIVSDLLAEDRFFSGRVALAGDFLFARQYSPDTAVLFGATPIVRYLFETESRWKPFADAGVGFALTDIGRPSLGGRFQFAPQAGAGLYRFFRTDFALSVEHRFVHYSNASMRSPNVGINQHMFLVGAVRFY